MKDSARKAWTDFVRKREQASKGKKRERRSEQNAFFNQNAIAPSGYVTDPKISISSISSKLCAIAACVPTPHEFCNR